ncbi:MAG: hypothetical protein R3F43_19240 [bacterium]
MQNPVDMIAQATPAQYAACAKRLLADPAVDALLVDLREPRRDRSTRGRARAIVEGSRPRRARSRCWRASWAAPRDEGIALLAAVQNPELPLPR